MFSRKKILSEVISVNLFLLFFSDSSEYISRVNVLGILSKRNAIDFQFATKDLAFCCCYCYCCKRWGIFFFPARSKYTRLSSYSYHVVRTYIHFKIEIPEHRRALGNISPPFQLLCAVPTCRDTCIHNPHFTRLYRVLYSYNLS